VNESSKSSQAQTPVCDIRVAMVISLATRTLHYTVTIHTQTRANAGARPPIYSTADLTTATFVRTLMPYQDVVSTVGRPIVEKGLGKNIYQAGWQRLTLLEMIGV
jgi:hypothetical protein